MSLDEYKTAYVVGRSHANQKTGTETITFGYVRRPPPGYYDIPGEGIYLTICVTHEAARRYRNMADALRMKAHPYFFCDECKTIVEQRLRARPEEHYVQIKREASGV